MKPTDANIIVHSPSPCDAHYFIEPDRLTEKQIREKLSVDRKYSILICKQCGEVRQFPKWVGRDKANRFRQYPTHLKDRAECKRKDIKKKGLPL